MALAKVMITCSKCGETFEKTATKFSRKDADAWEEWAEQNITLCPACYAKKRAQLDQERPLTLSMGIDPYAARPVTISWSGCTLAHRAELESLGWQWDEDGYKVLPRHFTLADAVAECKRIASTGLTPELDRQYSAHDYALAVQNAKKAEKLASIPKPQRPEWMGGGKWNGKVYGSSHNGYSVYVDGEKIHMTEEQHKELKDYLKLFEEYKSEKAQIQKEGV